MKQKMLALMLVVLCLFGCTACSSTPDPVGESVIKNDVVCQDDIIYSADMHLTSLTVTKRQTTPEQKTDRVWVDIVAENDESRYVASCMLSYGLYNEGWMLDSYEVLSDSFEYINGLDPAAALARANELMDEYYSHFANRSKGVVELVDMAMNGDTATCLFDHAEKMGSGDLLTIHWRFRIKYRMMKDGWSSGAWDTTMNKYAFDWNLVGEWRGSNKGEDFYMKVYSYDPSAKTVDVEYAFGERRSSGVETLYIVNQDFWDEEEKEWSLNADRSAHHGFVDLCPFGANFKDAGEGSGVVADSGSVKCWLTRVD